MSDWPPPQDPNATPGPPPQYPPPGQYPPAAPQPQYPPPAQYPPAGQYPPQYPPVPPPGYGAYPTPGYPPAGGSAYGAPPFAGFFSRLGARLIDAIIVGIPFGVAYGALLALPHSSRIVSCTKNGVQGYCHPPGSGAVAAAVIIGLLGVVFGIWYQIFLLGKTGQTWGCKAVDIKVVDRATGTPIGAGRAFGRLLVSIVSGWLCYLGYLWMLWDGEKQTWHDKAASAYVIRA